MEFMHFLGFIDMIGVPSLFIITLALLRYILKIGLGIQALLRSSLYDLYDTWTDKGYAPRDIKANFENLYLWYHALGKNGVMTRKYEEFLNLPDMPDL
jgi:hypothetical protein|nr:MAG TPA: hypothetical protein [Caudoviricetes sp.]